MREYVARMFPFPLRQCFRVGCFLPAPCVCFSRTFMKPYSDGTAKSIFGSATLSGYLFRKTRCWEKTSPFMEYHWKNAGTLGMVSLKINPIYTIIYWVYPLLLLTAKLAQIYYLTKSNSSPLKIGHPFSRRRSYSKHPGLQGFQLAVSFRDGFPYS